MTKDEVIKLLGLVKGVKDNPFGLVEKVFEVMDEEQKINFLKFMLKEVQVAIGFAMETCKYHKEGRDEMVSENFRDFLSLYGITEEEVMEVIK